MFVSKTLSRGFFQKISEGKNSFFTSLWNKPVTRDDRIKGYIPEVVEESLLEEKAVQLENNSRDIIVELGQKIVIEIEKKSPTSRIAPSLNKLMNEYGSKDLICQRPLSYLIYPTSSAVSPSADTCHELVLSFVDNFREMIEEIEKSGCSARSITKDQEKYISPLPDTNESAKSIHQEVKIESLAESSEEGTKLKLEEHHDSRAEVFREDNKDNLGVPPCDSHEPLDITLFVKVMTGMTLANISCSDFKSAEKCVDTALLHARDTERIGGLYGMKAGILVRQKKLSQAVNSAQKAIEISHNLQGFLQGAYALHQLNRTDEELKLLKQAKEFHPMNQLIAKRYEDVMNSLPEPLLRLEESSTEK